MLSLLAVSSVLSYASTASAELKFGGDAGIRARAQITKDSNSDDVKYQYRVRLKATAKLENDYYFKALMQNENVPGVWTTVSGANDGKGNTYDTERYDLQLSHFYFGQESEDCHFKVGRIPLDSINNPLMDLALYAVPTPMGGGLYAVDLPVFTNNFDRFFGFNYGTKVGDGKLEASIYVLDNSATTIDPAIKNHGLLNDGYALHLSYKVTHDNITLEPQCFIPLRNLQTDIYQRVAPYTFGANVTAPVSSATVSLGGYYTVAKNSDGQISNPGTLTDRTTWATAPASIDYTAYLLRLKAVSGPAMAWIDYNHTADKTAGNAGNYNNTFIWAEYTIKLNETREGANVKLVPTIRYRASSKETTGTVDNNQFRAELYTTVNF